jgi:flagellar biosynthesis/type III secretory pathway protein FliH
MSQYMSPFTQGVIDPQVAAARRQADISAQQLQSQYGKAGAYGGSRQGVAEAELQRGLLDRVSGIYGTGYQNAFEQAQNQFNNVHNVPADKLQAMRDRFQYDISELFVDQNA